MQVTQMSPEKRAEELRKAMRAWTSGVTVVTAAYDGETHGMTVSSFTSVSLDPPLIVISLQAASHTHALVQRSQAFGVTILSADQQAISERFAGHGEQAEARLNGLETETFVTGAPLIKGGLAYLDCRVTEAIRAGMNTVFLAEVVAVRGDNHETPLVYHDQTYRQLKD